MALAADGKSPWRMLQAVEVPGNLAETKAEIEERLERMGL